MRYHLFDLLHLEAKINHSLSILPYLDYIVLAVLVSFHNVIQQIFMLFMESLGLLEVIQR